CMFDETSWYAFGHPQRRTLVSAVAVVRRDVWRSLEKTQNAVSDRDGGRWAAVEPSSAHPQCPTESGPGLFCYSASVTLQRPLSLLQNALDFPNAWWTFWRARACSTTPPLCSHSNSA